MHIQSIKVLNYIPLVNGREWDPSQANPRPVLLHLQNTEYIKTVVKPRRCPPTDINTNLCAHSLLTTCIHELC